MGSLVGSRVVGDRVGFSLGAYVKPGPNGLLVGVFVGWVGAKVGSPVVGFRVGLEIVGDLVGFSVGG